MPLYWFQASLGFFKGGPVVDKDFSMSSAANLALPSDHGRPFVPGPLYRWSGYDELSGVAIPRNSENVPFTSPAQEVTDIRDFARSLAAVPMNLVEQCFPMRLVLEGWIGAKKRSTPEASPRPR